MPAPIDPTAIDTSDLAADGLVPPAPPPPTRELPLRQALKRLRDNALAAWPDRAYVDPMVVSAFLGRKSVILNDPDAIRHVLVDNAANYRRTPASIRILRPILGDGVLLNEGERWRHARRLFAPAFRPEVVRGTAGRMAEATDEALAPLIESPDRPVDLLSLMQTLALDIAARALFSFDMRRFGAALRRLSLDYGARLERPYPLDFFLPVWLPSPMDLRRRWFRRGWVALFDSMIEDRIGRGGPADGDLFDALTAAGEEIPPPQRRDEIATLLVAGHETTALALFWAFYLMARAPRCQEAVAGEAMALDLSPQAVGASVPQLVLARAVIDEALRLYPPAFTIVRASIGEDRALGEAVPPGSLFFIAPWVLHRHRRLWAAPDAFNPTRFLPGAPPPDRYAYLPFGAGPRVCLGAQFALTEATLVLAKIVRAFRVRLESDDVTPVAVVTTRPDHAPMFRLEKR